MEDFTAMTIKFLRARLFSERSVSRTARQRADELAKRVMELEEQLSIVSQQRKEAEKAAADVLAILEIHGRSDVSETFDSSSDQEEIRCDPKVGSSSVGGEESPDSVKIREIYSEPLSGSEHESSSSNGRSLSWKSSRGSMNSFEKKYMDSSRRRRGSFPLIGSSSPKRVGKSCRQIRHRELRSTAEGQQKEASAVINDEDPATSSDGRLKSSNITPQRSRKGIEKNDERNLPEVPLSMDMVNQMERNGQFPDIYEGDDMQRALERQAELIGRYEDEEKAQREWEEKFRETNGATPESCDPGNHSNITEERDGNKDLVPPLAPDVVTSQNQLANSVEGDATTSKHSMTSDEFQTSPLFVSKLKLNNDDSNIQQRPSLNGLLRNSDFLVTSVNNSVYVPASKDINLNKGEASENVTATARSPLENGNNLGSVLEALQQAKLSLKQNMDRLRLLEGGSSTSTRDRFPVPFGYGELFRLPTDVSYKASDVPKPTVSASSSFELVDAKLLARTYLGFRPQSNSDDQFLIVPSFQYIPEMRSGATTVDPISDKSPPSSSFRYLNLDFSVNSGLPSYGKFTSKTVLESKSDFSTDNRFLAVPTFSFPEIRSEVQPRMSFFNPILDLGLSTSGIGNISANRHPSSN